MEDALARLGADELRDLVRELLPWLDERARARLATSIVDRAVRGGSGWAPSPPSDAGITEIVSFAAAARRVGEADPSDVDDYLRQGSSAFLGRDYRAALEIFRALLLPISDGEIFLGEDEMADEVLGVDMAECAAQYVVATYMMSPPAERARAVDQAIAEVDGVGDFWGPLRDMERVALEPLPGFDAFLPEWRALIEARSAAERAAPERAAPERRSEWDTDADRWLREVVVRLEGAAGLAAVARRTRRADDLRAWCGALVEAKDWKTALAAYDEAAGTVTDAALARGEFLDGAALATRQLQRKDLPARLERAWREAPSFLRLRRWLGSAGSKSALKKRAAAALEVCPQKATRQRSFLHVLVGDVEAAAKLLAAAPGLGWSSDEHPGHLMFPLFEALLAGRAPGRGGGADTVRIQGPTIDELERMAIAPDEPGLEAPEVDEILRLAGIGVSAQPASRTAMLMAMRKAAEKRVAGVTENKRRGHYGHAAELVLGCAALDPSAAGARWLAGVRDTYRRYPAFQRELARKR
jgi:hypothetical protein